MTSKINEHTLCSLLFATTSCYETNLHTLSTLIEKTPKNALIVAPEVCLTGFDYERLVEARSFSSKAIENLKKISNGKIIILTIIEEVNNKTYNMLKVIYNGKVIHTRAKEKLFEFGGEEKFFTEGEEKNFEIIEVNEIKIAILICFELRFKDMWKRCEGADVIAVPSWWGLARIEHFKSFTKTLAIMNQCYVVASDSINEECSKMSAIVNPQGKVLCNGNKPCLEVKYDNKEIALMRRYMDVGIG